VVEFASNLFGGGMFGKYYPPFSWATADSLEKYDLEKALDTARKVVSRRGRTLGSAGEALFRWIASEV